MCRFCTAKEKRAIAMIIKLTLCVETVYSSCARIMHSKRVDNKTNTVHGNVHNLCADYAQQKSKKKKSKKGRL